MCLFIAYRMRSDCVHFQTLNSIFIFLVKLFGVVVFIFSGAYFFSFYSLLLFALLKSSLGFLERCWFSFFFSAILSLSLWHHPSVFHSFCRALSHSMFMPDVIFKVSIWQAKYTCLHQLIKEGNHVKKKERAVRYTYATQYTPFRCLFVQSIDLAASSTRVRSMAANDNGIIWPM